MKLWFSRICVLIFLTALSGRGIGQTGKPDLLRTKIREYLTGKKAEVGVGILLIETGDTLTFGNSRHYPMQSVYKFHLALAVLNKADSGKFTLDKVIPVTKSDLLPDTWSPLRDKYPDGGDLTLREILECTVSQSDNNGCDILFRLIGGPKVVDDYMHILGINDVSVKTTEAEMHADWKVQFSNWTTPFAAVQLLGKFYRNEEFLSPDSRDFLYQSMVATSTGPNRIKGHLSPETVVAHKTGSSGADKQGVTAATNDIGIITLPDGKHLALAVFVSNSTEKPETNERIIADIAKMAWDWYSRK